MASPEFHPTPHLIEKLKVRDVTWGDILDCLEHPEVIYPDKLTRKRYQKGDLCVVANRHGAVITVLLRRDDQWTDEDARNRSRDGN